MSKYNIQLNNLHLKIDEPLNNETIATRLKCSPDDIKGYKILKESFDARKQHQCFNYSLAININNRSAFHKSKDIQAYVPYQYKAPTCFYPEAIRPIIVGFGPGGMFAGLLLAEQGLRPIILERGSSIDKRIKDVDDFWNNKHLNPESNVQFGEGGAGTFSDGKLTTRIKDPRVKKAIEEFIEAGANEDISYLSHPHIGTDQLRGIVKKIREKIISLGGEIHFDSKVDEILLEDDHVVGVKCGQTTYSSKIVLLSIGHSASDTIASLLASGVHIEAKDFAVGVRVEHEQSLIDLNQYQDLDYVKRLGHAEYRLSHTASNGRGVYSFCMCPGGQVVASTSIDNSIVTNGMSYSTRDGHNANSAILVQVKVEDFYHDSCLDGFAYQHALEQKTFAIANDYRAPVSNIADYINKTNNALVITPTYNHHVIQTDLHQLFDKDINDALKEGLEAFDKKIPGFINQGIMIGSETRSSCPIRIVRNENLQSINIKNLYPCAEGAGYAGGIISSAVDGIRCGEAIINNINDSGKQV